MKLKTLSIFTGLLFIFSILIFLNENKRGSDLAEGSDYIKGLDVEKVQKISLRFKDDKKIILSREGQRFVIENYKSYPADSEKVNDLIYKIASIQVKEKMLEDASEDDLKKYELDEKSNKHFVEIFDNDDQKTVSFRVGKSYKGRGNYLYRDEKGEVYLSQNSIWLGSSHNDFINTVLVDIKKDNIDNIELQSGATEIKLLKRDQDFILTAPQEKSFKKEKVEEYFGNFSSIRFDDYYSYSDSKVRGLNFNQDIKVQLKNKLVYKLNLAAQKDNYFIKVSALVNEMPKRVTVSKDDGAKKLKNIDDMFKAQGEAQRFNREKGSWVYKIDRPFYEKLVKKINFFL